MRQTLIFTQINANKSSVSSFSNVPIFFTSKFNNEKKNNWSITTWNSIFIFEPYIYIFELYI